MSIEGIKVFVNSYLNFDLGLACVIAVSIFLCYLSVVQRRAARRRRRILQEEILYGLAFAAYIVFLLGGTLLNRSIGREFGAEWRLFWSYHEAWVTGNNALVFQIIYNVVAFVPWGFLMVKVSLPMRKFYWNVGIACVFSTLIEVSQLIFKCGLFEFDDIFHNTLGAVIGYGIWRGYRLWKVKRKK